MAVTPEVCEQLHLPLQSGSDAVLRAMRRGYTAERYLEKLASARAAIDDLAVTTDIIVGFPGESDEDFERTLEVCAEAAYDSAFTFIFSPRPGTRAAAMEAAFVPAEVIAERFERLKTVIDRSALARHQARVGRTEEALVEGVSRRDESMQSGRTRQGKLVHFAAPGTIAGAGGAGAGHRDRGTPPSSVRTPRGGNGATAVPRAHPGGQRLTAVALLGVTASGKSAAALLVGDAARGHRAGLRRFHVRLPGHGHRDVEARCVGPGRRPASSARPGRARPGFCRDRLPGRGPAGPWRTASRVVAVTLCSWAAPGCTCAPWSTTSRFPAASPTWRRASRPSSTTVEPNRPICMPVCRHSTRWPRPGWSPPTAAGSCGRSR